MEEQATENINDTLRRYYFNNKQGFQSLEKFYRTLKQDGVKVTKKQLQAWLNTTSFPRDYPPEQTSYFQHNMGRLSRR